MDHTQSIFLVFPSIKFDWLQCHNQTSPLRPRAKQGFIQGPRPLKGNSRGNYSHGTQGRWHACPGATPSWTRSRPFFHRIQGQVWCCTTCWLDELPKPLQHACSTTRSSAQGNCSAKSLAGNVVDSSLSSLSSPWASSRGGVGGRGHFIHLAIYCTTTWCFALKGLRTIKNTPAPVSGVNMPPGCTILTTNHNTDTNFVWTAHHDSCVLGPQTNAQLCFYGFTVNMQALGSPQVASMTSSVETIELCGAQSSPPPRLNATSPSPHVTVQGSCIEIHLCFYQPNKSEGNFFRQL